MTRLQLVPIVEGHGEQQSAIRTLVVRTWIELLGGEFIDVLQPIRIPKAKLLQAAEIVRAVDLAAMKMAATKSTDERLILVLFDADDDCPALLSRQVRETLEQDRSHLDVAIVVANVEFETWFVAAAASIAGLLPDMPSVRTDDPERARLGKGTIAKWMGGRYAETIDQPRLTAAIDLALCRKRSASYDKFCRELEKRLNAAPD